MTQPILDAQIAEQLKHLDTARKRQVLEFLQRLTRPRGTPFRVLLELAGQIPPEDLQRMEEAIEDCERIDPDAW